MGTSGGDVTYLTKNEGFKMSGGEIGKHYFADDVAFFKM